MNRSTTDNPTVEGYKLIQLKLAPKIETPEWESTGIHRPPAGHRAFVTLIDDVVTIGIEPVTGAPGSSQKSDKFVAMTDPELKTQCGIKGIPYTPETKRAELLAALRAKGK